MIKIKKLENGFHGGSAIVYDVGEIVKIEETRYDDNGGLTFSDSKGPAFYTSMRATWARYNCITGYVPIEGRENSVPKQYRENGGSYSFLCNDPRVIWALIVKMWLMNVAPSKGKRADRNYREDYLTSTLPSYEEAARWLKQNRFPVFITQDYQPGIKDPDSYYGNLGALKVPPEVDWTKVPDRE